MLLSGNNIIKKQEATLLDEKIQTSFSIPPVVLMEEAAEQILNQLLLDFSDLSHIKIAIIAGWGNNGGDALSLARKLLVKGIIPDIYIFKDKKGSELYELHKKILTALKVEMLDVSDLETTIDKYYLLLDGIFGIGYSYRENKDIDNIFLLMNNSKAEIVSIDVPSGLTTKQDICVNADYTYSIGFLKEYFFSLNVRKYLGKIRDLKISFDLSAIETKNRVFYYNRLESKKDNETDFVHKYSRGGCIAIGGSKGKFGAILYAALSSMSAGAGIALVLTKRENVVSINTMSKNVIVDSYENFTSYVSKYRSVIIGPGLTDIDKEDKKYLDNIIRSDKQFILDASFFSIYDKEVLKAFRIPPVITPHLNEFKTFFKEEAEGIEENSIDVVVRLASKYNAYIIFKDSFLIFASPDGECIVYDNPMRILAQAGSGDIFAGILAGIISQGHGIKDSILQGIRIFYRTAEKSNRLSHRSYEPDMFIRMISEG